MHRYGFGSIYPKRAAVDTSDRFIFNRLIATASYLHNRSYGAVLALASPAFYVQIGDLSSYLSLPFTALWRASDRWSSGLRHGSASI